MATTRRGTRAAPAPDNEMPAPAPTARGKAKKPVEADAVTAGPGAKGKKAALAEQSVNVAPQVSLEDELAALSAKLKEVTIEKEKSEVMLKEKDAMLQQKDEDNAKLKKVVQKLQKVKNFEPELDPRVLQTIVQNDVSAANDSEALPAGDEVSTKEKNKDPRKPKHPPSAYHLWNAESYQKVKSKHPNASMAEMSKIMSEMWKTVSDKVKQKYDAKYTEQMVVYKEALAAYEQILADEKVKEEALMKLHEKRRQEEAMKLLDQYLMHSKEVQGSADGTHAKKKAKDPEKPKQPASAFIYFCSDRRKQIACDDAKRNMAEETKALSEEWKKLKESGHGFDKYEKMAAADRERYATEMEAYKSKKQEEEVATKAEIEKIKKEDLDMAMSMMKAESTAPKGATAVESSQAATKPTKEKVKRGPSGYNLYCASLLGNLRKSEPTLTFGDISKRLGQAWKDLGEEEKAIWNAQALSSAPAASQGSTKAEEDFGI